MTPPADPDPAGSLIVSGGGSTLVATDTVLAEAALMTALRVEAENWQDRLRGIRTVDMTPAPAWTAADAGPGILALGHTIDAIAELSGSLADKLVEAADRYGTAERQAALLARLSAAGAASVLGHLAPFLAVMALPGLSSGALAWILASLVTGTTPTESAGRLAAWIADNPRLVTNPVLVAMVRALASSTDDGAAGVLGIPLPVTLALGEDGAQILGSATSAAGLLAAARAVGALRETDIDSRRVGVSQRSPPPRGVADLARRIPASTGVAPQVRIDRYGTRASPAWIVYVGGTSAWGPVTGAEPWDMTSNVTAMAEQSAGSYRAVEAAMRAAGVRPTDPVVGVGHSQGGLLVTQLAASGNYNTVGLATFGAPAGQVAIPGTVPVIAAEHSDDLVPALGGAPRDHTSPGSQHLVVRREVFAGTDVPSGGLPAHSMDAYLETAVMIDESPEPRLMRFRSELAAVIGSEPGETTLWRARRRTG